MVSLGPRMGPVTILEEVKAAREAVYRAHPGASVGSTVSILTDAFVFRCFPGLLTSYLVDDDAVADAGFHVVAEHRDGTWRVRDVEPGDWDILEGRILIT
jgi:hypothetical protein